VEAALRKHREPEASPSSTVGGDDGSWPTAEVSRVAALARTEGTRHACDRWKWRSPWRRPRGRGEL